MKAQVIPNMSFSVSLYSIQYITGTVYEKSVDNVNCGIVEKRKSYAMSSIFMTTAYTYEQARQYLYNFLLSKVDLYLREVIIHDYNSMLLTEAFDEAFNKYGDKNFEEKSEKTKEETEKNST